MRLIEQFNVDINKLSNRVIRRVKKAQQEAAQKICKDIKKRAPVNTGVYRDSIKVSETYMLYNKIRTRIYSALTLGGNNPTWQRVPLASIIENGTKPHYITPRNPEGVLRWEDENGVHYAKWVWHPGTIANPHWQRALLWNRDYYRKKINKAIKGKK